MKSRKAPLSYRFRLRIKQAADWLVAQAAFSVLGLIRLLGPRRAGNLFGFLARTFGRLTKQDKLARANVKAAFPEKSEAEIDAIVADSWDNLGRVAAEYPHMASIYDFDGRRQGNIEIVGADIFDRLAADGKPAIIFSAHLGNWELPAIAAARHGLEVTVLYRTPNNRRIADYIRRVRADIMGAMLPTGSSAVFGMAATLEANGHLGLLVDQRYWRGPIGRMFGRPALMNPVVPKLLRKYDAPVHGCRVIRLPDTRFRIELTEEIPMPRDARGEIDLPAAAQVISDVIEGWVRENPGQWLWQHNRWGGIRKNRKKVA
ncbi:MAG: lipid A biosynthesis lauroyl acyltransferase [Flavobacteriaceae bacterium]